MASGCSLPFDMTWLKVEMVMLIGEGACRLDPRRVEHASFLSERRLPAARNVGN